MAHSDLKQVGKAIVFLLLVAGTQVQAANIYRYVDSSGRTVFSASIPAEYAKNGYTILNERGQVIQEVPRAPTAEELAAKKAADAAQQAAVDAKKQQENADNQLIRLYRSPEALYKKRDESLGTLDVQIGLLKSALTNSETELARVQGLIDTAKAEGREASPDTVNKFEEIKTRLADTQQKIADIESKKASVTEAADRDAKRLRELLGLPAAEPAVSAEQPAAQQ